MKRTSSYGVLNNAVLAQCQQRIVYHEAGHAAAIHFNSQLNNLPHLNYNIVLADLKTLSSAVQPTDQNAIPEWVARVQGGRFIAALPSALDHGITHTTGRSFQASVDLPLAFETDIVNLLVGSLAEAKYIALQDGEPFALQLLNMQALQTYYGGAADIRVVYDYLHSLNLDTQAQEHLLQLYFVQAFNFVNQKAHWKAIDRLAKYLLGNPKKEIGCTEIECVLENPVPKLNYWL